MSDGKGLSRREMLRLGAAGTIGLSLPSVEALGGGARAEDVFAKAEAKAATPRGQSGKPRNIIFLVCDGMSMGVPSMAEPFSYLMRQRGTVWARLLRSPHIVNSFLSTASANSMVTDSAAAASAWGTGCRVNNAALNYLPDGTRLTPIAQLCKDVGKRVGLVTTDSMPGATPAGFAAANKSRRDYLDIATQYRGVVDVIMGGGREFFDGLAREDRLDLIGRYRKDGYIFLDNRSQVLHQNRLGKILGLFDDEQLPFTLDHIQNSELRRRVPTLAEMTRLALRSLEGAERGFLLQVEAARVDHAAHANDAAAMLWDQLAFDDAVAAALSFAADRDDTLVIVTSDHGNANPGLNGMGGKYADSTKCFERMTTCKASFGVIHDQVNAAARSAKPDEAAHVVVKALTGIDLKPNEAKAVGDAIVHGKPITEIHDQHQNWLGILGQALANHTGVAWTGISHTNDHVLLSALGPGADDFRGLRHHTAVFRTICDDWGLKNPNPLHVVAG